MIFKNFILISTKNKIELSAFSGGIYLYKLTSQKGRFYFRNLFKQ